MSKTMAEIIGPCGRCQRPFQDGESMHHDTELGMVHIQCEAPPKPSDFHKTQTCGRCGLPIGRWTHEWTESLGWVHKEECCPPRCQRCGGVLGEEIERVPGGGWAHQAKCPPYDVKGLLQQLDHQAHRLATLEGRLDDLERRAWPAAFGELLEPAAANES